MGVRGGSRSLGDAHAAAGRAAVGGEVADPVGGRPRAGAGLKPEAVQHPARRQVGRRPRRLPDHPPLGGYVQGQPAGRRGRRPQARLRRDRQRELPQGGASGVGEPVGENRSPPPGNDGSLDGHLGHARHGACFLLPCQFGVRDNNLPYNNLPPGVIAECAEKRYIRQEKTGLAEKKTECWRRP